MQSSNPSRGSRRTSPPAVVQGLPEFRLQRLVAGLALACMAAAAGAGAPVFPNAAQAQVQTVLNLDSTVAASGATQAVALVDGTEGSASFSAAAGEGHAQLSLSSGQLRADATSTRGFTAAATGWEFLSFDGHGTVHFAFDIDGVLSNRRPSGLVAVEASVRLFDVTTWSSYFGSTAGQQFVARNATESPFADQVGVAFDNRGVRGAAAPSCASQFITSCVTDSTGTLVPVDFALGGHATVAPDHLYLVQLQLLLYSFNPVAGTQQQAADFSHTAAFSFVDLDGLSYRSSSGLFLSPVPEPHTLPLLLLGLALLAAWARRRRS